MSKFKNLLKENPQVWSASYIIFYLAWFFWIEHRSSYTGVHVMECSADKLIPFCEYFIIPYMLWFAFITVTWVYLCFNNRKEFYQFILFIYSGMTLFLIISTVFPNGLNLRVSFDTDKNFCTRLVAFLQSIDTPTNVFPSIHVYNSVGACIALWKNNGVKQHPVLKGFILVLTASICMATVFLKQHSLVDVTGALVMSMMFYWVSYVYLPRRSRRHGYIYEPSSV